MIVPLLVIPLYALSQDFLNALCRDHASIRQESRYSFQKIQCHAGIPGRHLRKNQQNFILSGKMLFSQSAFLIAQGPSEDLNSPSSS